MGHQRHLIGYGWCTSSNDKRPLDGVIDRLAIRWVIKRDRESRLTWTILVDLDSHGHHLNPVP